MFIDEETLKILKNKNYRDSTYDNYSKLIKRIFVSLYGETEKYSMDLLFRDINKIIDIIDTYSESQKSKYIYVIKLVYSGYKNKNEYDLKKIEDYYEKQKDAYNNYTTIQEPTEKQKSGYITMEELNNVYDIYKILLENEESYENYMKLLIVGLYKYLPPVRPEVYINCVYNEYDEDYENYNLIDTDTKTLIIRKGKTHKIGKITIVSIPDELNSLILDIKKKYNTVYLLTLLADKTNPQNPKTFGQLFGRIFKSVTDKYITPNNVRNSYISNIIDVEGLGVTENRKRIAKILGHSINTENNIYSKYSKLIHK